MARLRQSESQEAVASRRAAIRATDRQGTGEAGRKARPDPPLGCPRASARAGGRAARTCGASEDLIPLRCCRAVPARRGYLLGVIGPREQRESLRRPERASPGLSRYCTTRQGRSAKETQVRARVPTRARARIATRKGTGTADRPVRRDDVPAGETRAGPGRATNPTRCGRRESGSRPGPSPGPLLARRSSEFCASVPGLAGAGLCRPGTTLQPLRVGLHGPASS